MLRSVQCQNCFSNKLILPLIIGIAFCLILIIPLSNSNAIASEINVKQDIVDIPNGTGVYDFGDVNVDSGSVVVFTIENSGETALELTGIPIVQVTGTHTGDFTVTLEPDTPVSFNENTTFEIMFSPSESGDLEAQILLYNNDLDETHIHLL